MPLVPCGASVLFLSLRCMLVLPTGISLRYRMLVLPTGTPGKQKSCGPLSPAQNPVIVSRSVRRALLTPQVNAGSRYRCGKRT